MHGVMFARLSDAASALIDHVVWKHTREPIPRSDPSPVPIPAATRIFLEKTIFSDISKTHMLSQNVTSSATGPDVESRSLPTVVFNDTRMYMSRSSTAPDIRHATKHLGRRRRWKHTSSLSTSTRSLIRVPTSTLSLMNVVPTGIRPRAAYGSI